MSVSNTNGANGMNGTTISNAPDTNGSSPANGSGLNGAHAGHLSTESNGLAHPSGTASNGIASHLNKSTHSNGTGPNGRSLNGHGLNGDRGSGVPNAYVQEPVAVVSMACRLPDSCSNPHLFWQFLSEGKIAMNTPPGTRFSLATHYDGSLKAQTMASPGGMFLQNVDPRDLDAQFFKLSGIEATSMDPQQRQLLEVVYEGLENGGVTLDGISGKSVGCFVSSFAVDYGDIQARDPENRASATVVGVGRAMLSNRISHFLNIKGPS